MFQPSRRRWSSAWEGRCRTRWCTAPRTSAGGRARRSPRTCRRCTASRRAACPCAGGTSSTPSSRNLGEFSTIPATEFSVLRSSLGYEKFIGRCCSAKIVFGLNALNGRVPLPDGSVGGPWDYTNAASLIRYTANKGYRIHGWELGMLFYCAFYHASCFEMPLLSGLKVRIFNDVCLVSESLFTYVYLLSEKG